jgi:hypothetical protein
MLPLGFRRGVAPVVGLRLARISVSSSRSYATQNMNRIANIAPPPPPPEPRSTTTGRNVAAGGFLLFCGLLYKWNKTGDLLGGKTLEDPVAGMPGSAVAIADRDAGNTEESMEEGKSRSQRIREQMLKEKDSSGLKEDLATVPNELRSALSDLRAEEASLRQKLNAETDEAKRFDLKSAILGIEAKKAILKEETKPSSSEGWFVFKKI